MVRRAADHCRRVPWAASWVQSGVVWASTRAKPISDGKPSWPVFGNKRENTRRTTRLSYYGPQIIYPSISQSYFMRRFYFRSQFAHIFLSDGIKNCLRKAKVKTSFWKASRDCREISRFWAEIRNLRTKLRLYVSFYDHWLFLWVTRPLNPDFRRNPVFALREQHQRLRYQPSPDWNSPWSCAPLPSDVSSNIFELLPHCMFCSTARTFPNVHMLPKTIFEICSMCDEKIRIFAWREI